MPGINTTRSEAFERSALLSILSYEVSLDLTTAVDTFYAKTEVRFLSNQVGAKTFIDVVAKELISATLNGRNLDTSTFDGETLFLDQLEVENFLTIEALAKYTNTGEGLHKFTDPADGEVYLYTQFETADARRMYACFDQPDLKATFDLDVIAPSHWQVISNQAATLINPTGENQHWHFDKTPRIPTYISALVAGPYIRRDDVYQSSQKRIPLGIYCRKSLEPYLDAEEIFHLTKQGFAYFEDKFGLAYPFEKYDQIAVAEFNAGAMENAGCVTFAEDNFVFRGQATEQEFNWRANTILHEMAHMWFGDLVTMKWWDDLWLNESFAEWASYSALYEATRFTNSWAAFNTERKNWAYRQDQLTSTHPIGTDMVDIETVRSNFDGITYAKGASALRQLVAYVGEDHFIGGLRRYFHKHAWGNTTLQDLLVELEAESGRDLKPWVATWLQTAGVNTLKPEITLEGDKYSNVTIHQSSPEMPVGSKELRPHRLRVGVFDIVNDRVERRSSIELDVSGSATSVPELAGMKQGDLLLINDGDLSYAKIRFDDRSLKTLTSYIDRLSDPLTQSLAWAAVWDMVRDGEFPATRFIPIALRALSPGSSLLLVAEHIARHSSMAIETYASNKHRDQLRNDLALGYWHLLTASAPGSNEQLALARGFATHAKCAAHPELPQYMREVLNGSIEGIVLDQEIRWHYLSSLAAMGKANLAELEAERDRDQTANGLLSFTYAKAALPSESGKEETWSRIMQGSESNHILGSLIGGFMQSVQRDLTAKFVDRYFDTLEDIWHRFAFETAEDLVIGLFPIHQGSEALLERTNKWLAGHQNAPSALLRFLGENRDALSRALKAQQCDQSVD